MLVTHSELSVLGMCDRLVGLVGHDSYRRTSQRTHEMYILTLLCLGLSELVAALSGFKV